MSFNSVPSVNDMGEISRIKLSAKNHDPQALKAAAKQFEALFMQQLLKSARAAKVGDDAFSSEQTSFYQDMFDQQMAQHLAAGKGLGIADLLVRQLQGRKPAQPSATADPIASKITVAPVAVPALKMSHKLSAAGDAHSAKQAFIDQILPYAEKAAKELGVPAQALIAQAALETGWGRHVVKNSDGSSSYNLFGIKADKSWKGDALVSATGEYTRGRLHTEQAGFRSYASVGEAFDDYVRFIKDNPRYVKTLQMSDSAQFAHSLQRAGYATDPAYAQKIAAIADSSGMQVAMTQARTTYA